MKLSITVEGTVGLNWSRWKQLVSEIQSLGFAGLFRSDHLTISVPPDLDSLELITSLTYLADHSQKIHFGSMVAPLSIRDPVMLARQAMALNDLSDGRMILGVGAGWTEREHTMFGYTLGDVKTRMDRLEEGLEVITRLIRTREPVSFEGRYFHLRDALLLPRPQSTTRIMVGGNGLKRTLPLVARYADIWNSDTPTVETFQECSTRLDELLRYEGRQPGDVTRTVMLTVMCWHDQTDLDRRITLLKSTVPQFIPLSSGDILGWFGQKSALGSPEQVIERLNAFAAAGAAELMIHVFSVEDIENLTLLAEHVVPYVN